MGRQQHDNEQRIRLVEEAVDQIGTGSFHRVSAVVFGIANAADGVEVLMTQYILEQHDFKDWLDRSEHKSVLSVGISAAVFVGMLVGSLVGGTAADLVGRKVTMLVCLAVASGSLLGVSLVHNLWLFVVFRFIGGVGVGGSVPALWSLAAELFPSPNRGFLLVVIAFFWQVGSLLVALMAYVVIVWAGLSWRVFVGLCCLPAGIAAVLLWIGVVESPKFLVRKGDTEGAIRTLEYIAHRCGVSPPSHVLHLLRHTHGVNTQHSSEGASCADVSLRTATTDDDDEGNLSPSDRWNMSPVLIAVPHTASEPTDNPKLSETTPFRPVGKQSYSSVVAAEQRGRDRRSHSTSTINSANSAVHNFTCLFQGKLLVRTVVLQTVWVTLNFGSYGLSSWVTVLFDRVGLSDVYLCAVVYAVASLPGSFLGAVLIDRVARKALLQHSLILSALSAGGLALALLFSPSHSRVGTGTMLTSASLFSLFSTLCWCSLDCVSAESFPTHCRNTAMGVLGASGRLASIAAQAVFAIEVESSPLTVLWLTTGVVGVGALSVMVGMDSATGKDPIY